MLWRVLCRPRFTFRPVHKPDLDVVANRAFGEVGKGTELVKRERLGVVDSVHVSILTL